MNPVQSLLPKQFAAVAQMGYYGAEGAHFAKQLKDAPDNAARLDAAIRAANSFDHAITASKGVPLHKFMPVGKYYKGYEIAKLAANAIIASGVVPGARQRVGRHEIQSSQQYFHTGLDAVTKSKSKYVRYRGDDFMTAAIEDAATGVLMLRNGAVAPELMKSLVTVKASVMAGRDVATDLVGRIDQLYKDATSDLEAQIAFAVETASRGVKPTPEELVPPVWTRN